MFGFLFSQAQVNYTAKDVVVPYDGYFRPGCNLGYNPPWDDGELADIAAGNPALGIQGVGVRTLRASLSDAVLGVHGYDIRVNTFQHYADLGVEDMTCIVGFPTEWHQDLTQYCPGTPSELFSNMYTPIWDNGENGTPVNDNNFYALYLYNVIINYKDHIKFWEIWNEPGFDYTYALGWQPPGAPGNWWENNPNPCDYKLRAPIFHYVRMLRISWELIKTYDPDSYVCMAGVGYESFIDAVLRNTDNPNDGSVTADYPHGGGAYFDVMGFHSYPHFDGAVRYWDNNIGGFVYTRHSDAAAAGIPRRQGLWQNVLSSHGFDGFTYPRKEWIITEINTPRQQYGDYMGSQESQINFILKSVPTCIKSEIRQMHVYNLGDKTDVAAATGEFDIMGLYQKLEGTQPYTHVMNPEGVAYKTVADILFETEFDPIETIQMNLPSTIDGGAYKKANGDFVYVLWAKATIDMSEWASANYSFPAGMNITELTKTEWDYSSTQQTSTIASTNINLNARPIFLTAGAEVSCRVPVVTAPTIFSGNVVKLAWDELAEATKYKVRYRPVGGTWSEVNATINERFLNELTENTTYEYQLKTVCSSENSVWSPTYTVTTLGDSCDRPITTSINNLTSTSATITWNALPNDVKYKVKYKPAGGAWTEIFANINSASLTGLTPSTVYKYKVKSKCATGWVNWTPKYTFSTTSFTNEDPIFRETFATTAVVLFPNPAHDLLNIVIDSDVELVRISNMNGRQVYQSTNTSMTQQVDISSMSAGVYLLTIITKDQEVITKKFIKE